MNDVMSRLRAADPQASGPSAPTDSEVASVLAAARSADGRHPAPPSLLGRRSLMFAGAAVALGAAAVPVSGLLRSDRLPAAQAAQLREVARRVASAAVPPGAVLYTKHRTEAIGVHVFASQDDKGWPPTDYLRAHSVDTDEQWWPLDGRDEHPLRSWRTTTTYVARRDEQRAARLTPDERRSSGLPPEAPTSGSERMSPRPTYTTLPQDAPDGPGRIANPSPSFVRSLPTDPTALESLVRAAPEVEAGNRQYTGMLYGLLTYAPTPQPVRATLLELLASADDPRLRVLGERTVGGRTGLVVHWDWQKEGEEDVIDKDAGTVIWTGWTLTRSERDHAGEAYADLPVGTVMSSTTLLDLAYVSKIGARV